MTVEQYKVLKMFLVEALENGYSIEDTIKYIKTQYLRLSFSQIKKIKIIMNKFSYEEDHEYKKFIQDINKILE